MPIKFMGVELIKAQELATLFKASKAMSSAPKVLQAYYLLKKLLN